jgi:hypothetical protein
MSKHHTKEEILEKLKYFQDPTFTFEPIEHVYHLKGKKLTSSTGYIDRFHKGFDKEYWSQRKADEAGVDVSVILEKWDSKRDRACHIGTLIILKNFICLILLIYQKNKMLLIR